VKNLKIFLKKYDTTENQTINFKYLIMKKLITRLFALDYKCNVLGITFSMPRAANLIFPSVLACAVTVIKTEQYLFDTPIGILLGLIMLLSIFFGFFYFPIFGAVKFKDLTRNQKWQYGRLPLINLTIEENIEWNKLNYEFLNKYKKNAWFNFFPLFLNPILALIGFYIIFVL
jgi:hypothetical protein